MNRTISTTTLLLVVGDEWVITVGVDAGNEISDFGTANNECRFYVT